MVCWADYDGDGDPDIYSPYRRQSPSTTTGELFQNNGNGTFTDVTAAAGLDTSGTAFRASCAWGDYDNDDDFDLYVVYSGIGNSNRLYRNNGNETFTNVAASAVVTGNTSFSKGDAAWADFDQDGDLDLYLTYGEPAAMPFPANQMFRNNGNGTFTDVAASAKVDITGQSRRALWADYDNDGRPDLYVVRTSGQADVLFHNDGNGTFSNVTLAAGIVEGPNCFDAAWADFNDDQLLDLLCVGDSLPGSQPQRFWINQGNGTFVDQAATAGLNTLGRHATAVAVLDKDNDGDVDAYLGCSSFSGFPNAILDAVLENNGTQPVFTNVATSSGADESAFPRNANATASADFNGDGVMDVLAAGTGSSFADDDYLWRGTSNTNQSITVKLAGTVTNTWGVGAKVTVIPDLPGTDTPTEAECLNANASSDAHRQEVIGGSLNQNSIELEFGLGSRPIETRQVDCVSVVWPRSGFRRAYMAVATNQTLVLKEENAELLVTRVTPYSGSPSGGTAVTVYGFQFVVGAAVFFGNVLATNIVYVSTNIITCTTPLHAAGVVDVRVENTPTVTNTLVGGYTYVGAGQEIDLRLAKDVAQGKVNLTWTDVNQGTYYRVKRALGPRPSDFSPAPLCTIVAGRSYADAVLNNGVSYYYLVDTALACP